MADREITFFDVDVPAAKKKRASSKKGAASAAQKSTSSGKSTATATKKTASAAKKTTSTAQKTASTAKKPTSAAKKATAAKKPAAKKNTSAGKTAAAGKKTTARKRVEVQENPLANSRSSVHYVNNRPHPAAGRPARKSTPARPAPKRRKKRAMDGLSAVLLICLAAIAALGVWRVSEYRNFQVMKQAVSAQTFYSGTRVDGVDVSDMTLPQAIAHWEQAIEPGYSAAAVTLDDGTQATALQLGYSSDYVQVLTNAWNSGRSGSLEERYAHLTGRMNADMRYSVTRFMYDPSLVRRYAQALAGQIDAEPSSASIQSFNTQNYTFSFSEGRPGRTLNQEKLVQDVMAALDAGGGSVQMEIATRAPAQSLADVQSRYGLISYAITNASSSSSNRLTNIRRSLELINGICLEPGETFSFNQVVGERTEARGFKVATAYFSGEVTEQVGGGICQVSTTLFNAVVKADLKINERHPHSLTVSYVDLGKDAAVDWGNKDLRFTNNTQDKIYICCYLTDDKRIRFGVFGKLLPNGESITIEGVQTGVVDYETEYQVNFTMASGAQNVVQKGKNGYTATAYKIRWDANGNQISRDELCKSRYQATKQIIEYGP